MSRIRPGSCLAAIGLLLGLTAPPSVAQETGKKLALLVGVNKYDDGSGFSSLPFPGATSTSSPGCCSTRATAPSTSAS